MELWRWGLVYWKSSFASQLGRLPLTRGVALSSWLASIHGPVMNQVYTQSVWKKVSKCSNDVTADCKHSPNRTCLCHKLSHVEFGWSTVKICCSSLLTANHSQGKEIDSKVEKLKDSWFLLTDELRESLARGHHAWGQTCSSKTQIYSLCFIVGFVITGVAQTDSSSGRKQARTESLKGEKREH